MQHAKRDLAACRSRARKIMSSIFLSNRSTRRIKLNSYLTCHFQMYSTRAPVCWNDSLAIQYGACQFYITFYNQRAPTGSVVGSFCACLTRYKYSKDIWWCSRWCQRMFLQQNASISCWGCSCHQSWYTTQSHFLVLVLSILRKYYNWLCRHDYGVDFVVFSFRILTDGAFLTLRTPAHGLWNLAYPRCGHAQFI